jgi:rhamnosyltransferase subunit B
VHVLFATLGSAGDTFPFIPVMKAMQDEGHQVTAMVTPELHYLFRREAMTVLLPRRRTRPADLTSMFSPEEGGYTGLRTFLLDEVLPDVPGDIAHLHEVLPKVDVVVSHPLHLGSQFAAERHGVPAVRLSMYPQLVPSDQIPPPFALDGTVASAWSVVRRKLEADVGPRLSALRRDAGLSPVGDYLFAQHRTTPTFLPCSPAFFPPPSDWPSTCRLTHFSYWDQPHGSAAPDEEIERFLDDGEPPLLVTVGTALKNAAGGMFDEIVAAGADLGLRVLVVGAPDRGRSADGQSLCIPYAPLSTVAPRCRAAVHHAGQGTLKAFLRAGIPTLALPRAFDQPWNADRLVALGVGARLDWPLADRRRVRSALEGLLGDRSAATAAERFAERLTAEPDGATVAVRAITSCAR